MSHAGGQSQEGPSVRGVRRGLGVLGALVALGGAEVAAQVRAKVAMPYTCLIEHEQVVAQPSLEQSYDILGRHEQQPFTVCFGPDGAQCRTWMVHRFTLACGGVRVPWIEVVAAAAASRPGR